jgi:hypothetical protein
MQRVLVAFAAAASFAACGPNSNQTQQFEQAQKPVTPKGLIVGRVIDVNTQTPIEGVTVKVLGSDATLTSGADGVFTLTDAVAGSTYTFILEKGGFLRRTIARTVPSSAGNSPLAGGLTTFIIELYPSVGSVTGIVTLPNGRPAAGATVYVDQNQSVGSESTVSAQTGMDGSFTLMGLAAAGRGVQHIVYAQWFDENGDMQADYSTIGTSVTVYPGQPARIFLAYSALTQRVVSTNIFDGELAAGEDIQFTFALPLFTGVLSGATATPWVLTHLATGADIPVEGTFMSPTQLRVKPALNSLREGEVYRLALQLRNASTGTGTSSNFTPTLDFQVRPAMVMPYTTQVTGLTVTNPSAIAPFGPTAFDFNQNSFTLAWLPAAGAVRYEIHARDTTSNPNFVRVNTINANGAPRYELTQTLPSGFGPTFPGFGAFPLAGGNQVFFAVVGVDAFGSRAPLMGATAVQVRDSIPPSVTALTLVAGSSNDGINDGASPSEVRLRLTYSEPMDPMSAVTYTTNATNAPTSAWRWDGASSGRSGVLTLTIAAGNDATGSFTIRGGRDQAGNDLSRAGDTVGVLGGRRELLQTPDFQMGTMCQLGSWMPVVAMGGPTPSAVNNNGAFGGNTGPCAALLGSAPGGVPGVGRSRIAQSVTLPMVMNSGFSIEATGRYRVVNLANSATAGAAYRMECRVTDTSETMPLGTLFSVLPPIGTASTSYTSAGPVSLTALGGTQIRMLCEAENVNTMAPGFGALYLDELSVALVKPGTL